VLVKSRDDATVVVAAAVGRNGGGSASQFAPDESPLNLTTSTRNFTVSTILQT